MEQSNSVNQLSSESIIQKPNSFLITLLSILLLISCLIAGFFAWQTQNLVKELNKIRSVSTPTSTPIWSPEPLEVEEVLLPITNINGCSTLYPNTKYQLILPENWKLYYLKDRNINTYQKYSYRSDDNNFIDIVCGNGLGGACIQGWVSDIQIPNTETSSCRHDDGWGISFHSNVSDGGFSIQTNIESPSKLNVLFSKFKLIESKNTPSPVACTMEAKICPGGSSVSRTGPNCEFAPCP